MIVALYPDHHHLPFWHSPTNAKEVFDPEVHAGRLVEAHESRWVPECRENMMFAVGQRLDEVGKAAAWNVLMGLHSVDAPQLMGHVSLLCNCGEEKRWWHWSKRFWVQISTLPEGWEGDGIPEIVADDGKTLRVRHVWSDTSIHRTPYGLIPEGDRDHADAEYWKNFFSEKIRGAHRSYASTAAEGYENAERFWSISQTLASQALS